MRDIALLGSTGSIGTQAIEVVVANPDRFRIVALAAGGGRVEALADQAAALGVQHLALADPDAEPALRAALAERGIAERISVEVGADAASAIARRGADVVLNGMTGSIGLAPTLAALGSGSTLALANKESLIIGGRLVTGAAAAGQLVPVDSEHSALAQCLRAGAPSEVARLVLTASGGPFRGRTREQLREVTAGQALDHPTWSMGPVITTNSATLVNKGLELIEAHLLFDIPLERIEVVVHPQSMVHSWVEFVDGSCILQASPPDMRLPIALALGWPDRVPGAARPVDITTAATWEFCPLDDDTFPAVALARRVGQRGGTYPGVYNAANEVCVEAFLAGDIGFVDIVDTVQAVVLDHERAQGREAARPGNSAGLDDVLAADAWARRRASEVLNATSRASAEGIS